jgi:hypothetical protein
MTSLPRTVGTVAVALVGLLALSSCTPPGSRPSDTSTASDGSSSSDGPHTQTSSPTDALTVISSPTDEQSALDASRTLFDSSPVVFLAPGDDSATQEAAAHVSVELGVPLLIAPTVGAETSSDAAAASSDALDTELDRLATRTVVVVGDVGELDVGEGFGATENIDVIRTDATEQALDEATSALPAIDRATPLGDTIALALEGSEQIAAVATSQAAGLAIVEVPASTPNPQASSAVIEALHASPATKTLAIGAAFGGEAALEWKIRTAQTGDQLPGGGQLLFPSHQFVAIYGAPGTGSLGVLGEQDAAGSVQRARDVAAPYTGLTDKTVVPMFEIIATVAAGSAGADGDYSNELDIERLRPWVDAATAAGMYVVIDLQPGRTDFLTQAKRYESLLALPNVGLAIDPEWRLAPDQVPLKQIGQVSAAEVNAVTTWLADLTNSRGLPQKMVVLHQFQLKMLQNRDQIDTSRPELAMLIHADGQGAQPDKQATWRALHEGAPAGIAWGWKNFYDEDAPMLTPEQTVTDVSPLPDLITYQ